MANEEFVVVAFPIVEFSEQRKYSQPTVVRSYETETEAELSAADMICVAEMDRTNFTYEAMTREKFNNLDWPTIDLTYGE